LAKAVTEGKFREDLYYRLNVFPITVPPLRTRGDDVALLANAFLIRSLQKLGRKTEQFTENEIERLTSYDWPGNVRELQNVIERAVIVSHDGRPNLDRALPVVVSMPDQISQRVLTVRELEDLEKKNILAALKSCNWKIAGDNGAAKLLGMKPSTLNSRISSLGIKRAS
jgi:formate hydrogenlyase transcriptional activator